MGTRRKFNIFIKDHLISIATLSDCQGKTFVKSNASVSKIACNHNCFKNTLSVRR